MNETLKSLKQYRDHGRERVKIQCLECAKKFFRALGPNSVHLVHCPKCGSNDLDIC